MPTDTQCVPNIGPRGRRQRMAFGIVAIAIGVGLAVSFVALGVARPWRLALFLPFVAGAVGVFQARAST